MHEGMECDVGIDQADRGQTKRLSDELVQDVKDRGRKRLSSRKGRHPA